MDSTNDLMTLLLHASPHAPSRHPLPPPPRPAAYDFDSSNSAVGNGFMNSIQPYAARRPYMGSAGKCVPAARRCAAML